MKRRDTILKSPILTNTMLNPPQHAAHLVMFKISIHLCRSRCEKLNAYASTVENPTTPSTVEYTTATLNGRISTDFFLKSSNCQDHLFRA